MMTEIAVLMVVLVNSGYFSVDGRDDGDNNGYNCSVVMVIMVMMVIIALL